MNHHSRIMCLNRIPTNNSLRGKMYGFEPKLKIEYKIWTFYALTRKIFVSAWSTHACNEITVYDYSRT